MISIRKFREWAEPFLRRISPILFRELLRFMRIYHFFCRGNKKKGIGFTTCAGACRRKAFIQRLCQPQRTIWTTMFVPSEILFAMGLYPFCLEIGAALFAGLGQSSKGLLEAESYGVSTDICTFHRSAIGHAFRNLFPRNILQVATTTLCDNNTKTTKICETVTGKETIVIDVPYEEDDYSVSYLAKQLEDFTKRLEEVTGMKMKQESFEQSIEYSNQTRAKMLEINELRKDPYCPLQAVKPWGLCFRRIY